MSYRSAFDRSRQWKRQQEMEEAHRQSPLGLWMAANSAELDAKLLAGTMDWEQAAQDFGLSGLRDASGRTPTAETAQEIWQSVSR